MHVLKADLLLCSTSSRFDTPAVLHHAQWIARASSVQTRQARHSCVSSIKRDAPKTGLHLPRATQGDTMAAPPLVWSPTSAVQRHIDAFNARDLDTLLQVMAPNCVVEGLAYADTIRGKQDLEPFYRALLARVPAGMQLVVDDIGGDGSASVGVTWHLELDGVAVPYGRGLSFYRIDSRQQVAYLRESPEHVAKVPLSSLPIISLAAPLLRALGPIAPGVFARRRADTPAMDDASPAMLQAKLAHTQQELQRLQARLQQMQEQRAAAEQRLAAVAAPLTAAPLTTTQLLTTTQPLTVPEPPPQAPPATTSAAPVAEARVLDISGVWIKDEQLSDIRAYSVALDLMQLNTLQKHAALRLFEGVEITQDASGFAVRFLTVVPFFKVTESFAFGHEVAMGRRDLKPGQQAALAVASPQRVEVTITWPAPNAGDVLEVYTCPEPDVLHLLSRVTVGGRSAETLQVYRRQDTWVPQNTWGH